MIQLDTNCLIALVTVRSPMRVRVVSWLKSGQELAVSAVAWSEFLNGPVKVDEIRDASLMIQERILPFGVREAELASKLFHLAGRRRGSQPDCFIAATAIQAGASLATEDARHFELFFEAGLRLA